jgi:NADH-quinone oxidoreductase subunit E
MGKQSASVDTERAARVLEELGLNTKTTGRSRNAELLIPLLQRLQAEYGYLPPEVLSWVSTETGIPTSRMYGVITFYSQFYTAPRGRHIVRCCQGTACHVKGGKRVAEALTEKLGIGEGETTPDGNFTFEAVQCLGTCFLAPVAMVDDDYYGQLTHESAPKILEQYMDNDDRGGH